MKPATVLCHGVPRAELDALAARLHPEFEFTAVDDAAATALAEADVLLIGERAGERGPRALAPAVAWGVPSRDRARVLAGQAVVYSVPSAQDCDTTALALRRIAQASTRQAFTAPRTPPLDAVACARVHAWLRDLGEHLREHGARSLRLCLAEHRLAPLVSFNGLIADGCMNAHSEGIAAFALRCGASLRVPHLAREPRAVLGVDYLPGEEDGALALIDLGQIRVGELAWHAVLQIGAARAEALDVLEISARAALEVAFPRVPDAALARVDVYRPRARQALATPDDTSQWPPFAPAWTRRLARHWPWAFLVLPLIAWIPVPRTLVGDGELVYPGAPAIVSPAAANVERVLVRAGDRVDAGQVLLTLRDPGAESALDDAFSTYRAMLRQRLWSPENAPGNDQLAEAWERVAERVAQRHPAVVAPVAGIVREVPLAQGRAVAAGEVLAWVMPEDTSPSVELTLPSNHHERLVTGVEAWLRLPDGEEVALRVDALGGLARVDSGRTVLRARASVIDPAARALMPGLRGAASVRLAREPLYRVMWSSLTEPRP